MTPRTPIRAYPKRFNWDNAATIKALKLKAHRVTNKDIAHQLGTSLRVVEHKLRGVPGMRRAYTTKPIIQPSVASTRVTAIDPTSPKQHIKWDENTISKLLRLSERGVRQEDIASALGTTVAAIKAQLSTVRNAPQEKPVIKKWLPCLGCGKMMKTTIEIRQCDACKSLDRYQCGLWR